jgi:hypothetical protein
MHHNKPSCAAPIESMEDGDVRDHERLNLVESGQRALLKMTQTQPGKIRECQSVHQQETFLKGKIPDAKLCPSDPISLQHYCHGARLSCVKQRRIINENENFNPDKTT